MLLPLLLEQPHLHREAIQGREDLFLQSHQLIVECILLAEFNMIIEICLKYSKFNKLLDLCHLSITVFEHLVDVLKLFINPGYLCIMAFQECLEIGGSIEGHHLCLQLVLSGRQLLIELLLSRHAVQTFHNLLQIGNCVLLEFCELVSWGFGIDLKG